MTNEVLTDDFEAEELEHDQYLVFATQSQEFGFQAIMVQEITSVLGTTEVPNTPPYIEGIINLRGRLATVINFRKKFGFEPKEHDEDTRIIIVEQEGFPIGITVDSVEEVIKIPDEKVHELPASIGTSAPEEAIKGVGMLDERLIILLDVEQVLTKAEIIEAGAISRAVDSARALKSSEKAESKKVDAAEHPDVESYTDKEEGE